MENYLSVALKTQTHTKTKNRVEYCSSLNALKSELELISSLYLLLKLLLSPVICAWQDSVLGPENE